MKPGARSLAALLLLVLVAGAGSQWWQAGSERRQGERLAALAQPGDIRMLSSVTCPFCAAARRWMDEHRVRYDECMIERDTQCNALYQATLARGTPTLLVRGKVQLGFSPERVIDALEATPRAPG